MDHMIPSVHRLHVKYFLPVVQNVGPKKYTQFASCSHVHTNMNIQSSTIVAGFLSRLHQQISSKFLQPLNTQQQTLSGKVQTGGHTNKRSPSSLCQRERCNNEMTVDACNTTNNQLIRIVQKKHQELSKLMTNCISWQIRFSRRKIRCVNSM